MAERKKQRSGGRPKGMQRMTQSLSLDMNTIDRLEEEAERLGVPKSQLVDQFLKDHFTKSDEDERPAIISIMSFKGGCAKTTTAASLAICLGERGHRVLIIDFDGQGNISQYFNAFDKRAEEKCISDVLFSTAKGMGDNRVPLDSIIHDTAYENVSIAPANYRFADADADFRSEKTNSDSLLKFAIEDMQREFDYIIIDCAPSLNMTVTNAIVALEAGNKNSMIIIPVKIDGFAIAGVGQTVNTINRVATGRRTDKPRWFLLKTIAEVRTDVFTEGEKELDAAIPNANYFDTIISKGTKVPESSLARIPFMVYEPDSKPAKDYRKLTDEIEAMNG